MRRGPKRTVHALEVALDQSNSLRLAAESSLVAPANPGRAMLLSIHGAERSTVRGAMYNNRLLAALQDCREERTLFAPSFQTRDGRTGRTTFNKVQVTADGTREVGVGIRSEDPAQIPWRGS